MSLQEFDPIQLRKARRSFTHESHGKIGRLTLDRRLATDRRDNAQEQGTTDPFADRQITRLNNLIRNIQSQTEERAGNNVGVESAMRATVFVEMPVLPFLSVFHAGIQGMNGSS